MRLLVEENHDVPLVRLELVLPSGGGDDPAGLDGLTNFASELMARGAGGRSRAELDRAFDALGATLEVVTDLDAVYYEVTVLREHAEAAMALLADVLLRPTLSDEEADKLERETLGQLDELRDDDGQLARRFFSRALYGGHPYARSVLGTAASLARIERSHVDQWRARVIGSDTLMAGVAGDMTRAEAEALMARHLVGVPAGGRGWSRYDTAPRRRGLRLTLVDKPERSQSQILWGQPAPKWGTPDFFPLQVATLAYGGTFTARLMNEVRVKRGFSYGASARLGQGRSPRALVAHIFPSLEQTAEALALVLELHAAWVEGGITAEELAFAQGYLTRSFAFAVATPEDRLDLAMAIEVCELPKDHVARYRERISAVTLDDTRRAMQAHLAPRDLEVCIVCTADELRPKLEASGVLAGVEIDVIPYDRD